MPADRGRQLAPAVLLPYCGFWPARPAGGPLGVLCSLANVMAQIHTRSSIQAV